MREADTIYNRYGQPELRLLENGRLVMFNGTSVGFVKNGHVYTYSGKFAGWYEGEILRDRNGYVVGFGENPTDYPKPILPIRAIKPIPSIVHIEPIRPITQIPPIKPIKSFSWSAYTPISLLLGGSYVQ